MAKETIVLFILLLMLAGALYLLYDNLPKEPEQLTISDSNLTEQLNFSFGKEIQFHPNMRFSDRKINFRISKNCTGKKKQNMLDALKILSDSTLLSFYETEKAGINISCSEEKIETGNMFIAGEGGPTYAVNTSLYYVISNAKILLLREDECEKPIIALHELLHALGFDHVEDEKSIMYPITKCNQEITSEIIETINKLYFVESLPDLYISDISAVKRGKYLDFEIEVINQGLRNIENTTVAIFLEDDIIKSFSLGDIEIGAGKILTIQNLRIRRDFDRINFRVDENNEIREIYETNNIVYMRIEN